MKTFALITAVAALSAMPFVTPVMAQVDDEPDPHFGPAQEGGRSEATPGYGQSPAYNGPSANGYYMSEPQTTATIKQRRHTTPQWDQPQQMPQQGTRQR